jgi:hypothetical protein
MDRSPPDQDHDKTARHAEIDARYDWHRKQERAVRPRDIGAIRIHELERLFRHRYGSNTLPDDDSGRDDLRIVVEHLMGMAYSEERFAIGSWSSRWAPWISEQDLEQLVDDAGAHPRGWSAQALGEALGLTYAERKALKITTIQCVDKSLAEVKELQKVAKRRRDRERQRRKREAAKKDADLRCSPNPIESSMRAEVVYYTIGSKWKTVKSISRDVAESPAFKKVNKGSLKMVVHRALNELVTARLIERKAEPTPGKLRRHKVRRPPMVP